MTGGQAAALSRPQSVKADLVAAEVMVRGAPPVCEAIGMLSQNVRGKERWEIGNKCLWSQSASRHILVS